MQKTGLCSMTCQAVWEVSKTNPGKQPWESQGAFFYFPWQPSWELSCLSSSMLALSPVSVAQGYSGCVLALRAVQGKNFGRDVERRRSCSWLSRRAARQGDATLRASLCSCLGRWDMELLPVLAPGADHSSPRGLWFQQGIPQSHCNANEC